MALHIVLPFPASLGGVALSCIMLFSIHFPAWNHSSIQFSFIWELLHDFFHPRAAVRRQGVMSLCPRGHGVPGQHEVHEAKPLVLRLVSQEDILSPSQEWGGGKILYFSQSYSKSSDLTSAKGSQSQIWHFPDAGEIGCGVADLSLMRHVPALLKAGVQAVAAGRKRQFAVVENKKKKRDFSSASKAQKAKWAIHIISIFLGRSG